MSEAMSHFDTCDPVRWAAPGIRDLKPYLPGKPISELEREYGVSDIIKLASNENPLGASPHAIAAMQAELSNAALYPEGGYELCQALAGHHVVDPACITLGNGSNDVLVLLAEAFLQPGSEAVFSQYCFAVYPIACQATGATARVAAANPADHTQPFGHDLAAMHSLVNDRTRLIFIANPNNPTGTWLEKEALQEFVQSVPKTALVVIDEAYFEYGALLGLPDASAWLADFPNLVVTRTFSKAYGMAGIRFGYCLSSPVVADLLNRIRQPFNVNSLAMVGATAALADQAFINRAVKTNAEGLGQLGQGLKALGLKHAPSAGNFMLVDVGGPAHAVFEDLLRQGIIVRPVANYGLDRHLRITVGTGEQNERLLLALAEIMGDRHS